MNIFETTLQSLIRYARPIIDPESSMYCVAEIQQVANIMDEKSTENNHSNVFVPIQPLEKPLENDLMMKMNYVTPENYLQTEQGILIPKEQISNINMPCFPYKQKNAFCYTSPVLSIIERKLDEYWDKKEIEAVKKQFEKMRKKA